MAFFIAISGFGSLAADGKEKDGGRGGKGDFRMDDRGRGGDRMRDFSRSRRDWDGDKDRDRRWHKDKRRDDRHRYDRVRSFRFYFSPFYYRNYREQDCFYDRAGRLVCYDPYTGTYYYY